VADNKPIIPVTEDRGVTSLHARPGCAPGNGRILARLRDCRPDGAGIPRSSSISISCFARSQNALRGRWENSWSPEQVCVVKLVGREDVMDKLVYTAINSVKDGLVDRVDHWPGVNGLQALLTGRCLRAERPRHFFRRAGVMPEAVELRLTVPGRARAGSRRARGAAATRGGSRGSDRCRTPAHGANGRASRRCCVTGRRDHGARCALEPRLVGRTAPYALGRTPSCPCARVHAPRDSRVCASPMMCGFAVRIGHTRKPWVGGGVQKASS